MNDTLQELEHKKRVWTIAAWAVMVLAPWIQLAAFSLAVGQNAFSAYPTWTDELDYWRALFSWLQVGFHKGYSGIGEYAPALGSLSVHGLTPIMLYGGFCKVFGLGYNSIVLCNALWISAAALTFCLLLRPKASVALAISGLFAAYVPAVLYAASSMTELFNYALLLLYLAFGLRYVQKKEKWAMVLCWVTVAFGCLYRITYLVLFIPLVWGLGDQRLSVKTLLWGLLALLISGAVYGAGALITAPYPNGFLYNWLRVDELRTFIQMFLSHAKSNLIDYFVRPTGNYIEEGLRWVYCPMMLLLLLGAFVRFDTKEKKLKTGFQAELFGCFLMLFLPFALVVMIYETNDWSDFRTLAPFLWGVAVFLAIRGRRVLFGLAGAGFAALLIYLCFIPPVGILNDIYRYEKPAYSEAVHQACQAIEYDADAVNPFTNTARADLAGLQVMEEVHPGIGLMYGWFTPDNTGKSHWILTDHLKIVVEGYRPVYDEYGAKVYRHIASDEP